MPGHLDNAVDAAASAAVKKLIKVESVPEPEFGMALRLIAPVDKEILAIF